MQQTTNAKISTLTHFYIPSVQKLITRRQYLDLYKKCKLNPNTPVERTISKWWGGTTDDVIKEMQNAVMDRIFLRQKQF
jgi:hypothetical protein